MSNNSKNWNTRTVVTGTVVAGTALAGIAALGYYLYEQFSEEQQRVDHISRQNREETNFRQHEQQRQEEFEKLNSRIRKLELEKQQKLELQRKIQIIIEQLNDDCVDCNEILKQLDALYFKLRDDAQLLWPVGQAYYQLAIKENDITKQRTYIKKGIAACKKALSINRKTGEAHKWLCNLMLLRFEHLSIKQQIMDSLLFEEHINNAVQLLPNDSDVHRILGSFHYEFANLSWWKRELATIIAAELPQGSFKLAIIHLQKADCLSGTKCKKNNLFIAKSHIALGNGREAAAALKDARLLKIMNPTNLDFKYVVKEESQRLVDYSGQPNLRTHKNRTESERRQLNWRIQNNRTELESNRKLQLERRYRIIDEKLNDSRTNYTEILKILEELNTLCSEFPVDLRPLWRVGQACYKLADKEDDVKRNSFVEQGITACEKALKINDNIGGAHKWLCVLMGFRIQNRSNKELIIDSFAFKEHINKAVKMLPNDSDVHFMLGRFQYELANLSWFERKGAVLVYAEPPQGSFDCAKAHLLKADSLSKTKCKRTKLFIAKTHIALSNSKEAAAALRDARTLKVINRTSLDSTVDSDVENLYKQYSSYC